MGAPRFVHLRMHSEYSVSDGIVRIEQAVERAKADGMPALALTDAANLFGMVKFYGAARAAGVKPIVGADCWVENSADRDKPSRVLLLCASRAGYLRLCDLLSRAWLKNQHRGRAELSRDWLRDSDGLIALSGAAGFKLALAIIAPGNASRKAALVAAARPAVRIMYGAAVMFLAAAFVEAFWSPLTEFPFGVKIGVGVAFWLVLLAYFALAGRDHASR